MTEQQLLTINCSLFGLAEGIFPLLILFEIDPGKAHSIPCIPFEWAMVIFPAVGALSSAVFSLSLKSVDFGPLVGLLLSIVLFLLFCLVASIVWIICGPSIGNILRQVFGSVLIITAFGALWFSWMMLPMGLVFGIIIKWRTNKHMQSDAAEPRR